MSAEPVSKSLVNESVHQWTSAMRRMCVASPRFEEAAAEGVSIFWGDVDMLIYNHAILNGRAETLDEFRTRFQFCRDYAAARHRGWMFSVCEDWIPAGASQILVEAGLAVAMPLTGMVTTELRPAREGSNHDIRPLSGRAGAELIGTINCTAYDMPLSWAADTGWEGFFGPDVFSYALYHSEEAASTATVFVIENCLNVVAVATLPQYQRRGYAEAVMRKALSEAMKATGINRTVLHASRAGRPIYERMGYQPVVEFTAWSPSH